VSNRGQPKNEADAEEASQKREQALMKMKTDSDEAIRKIEQLFMEHELKCQKMLVDANTALSQKKLKADMNKEIASLEAFERRELEFQQLRKRKKKGQLLLSKN